METGYKQAGLNFRSFVIVLLGIALIAALSSCASRQSARLLSQKSAVDESVEMGAPGMKGAMGGAGMPGMPGMSAQAPSVEMKSKSVTTPSSTSSTFSSFSLLVIKTADLTVEVPNIDVSINKAINTVKSVGGFVESSSYNRSVDDKHPTANLTIRVPSSTFENVLSRISDIGKIVSKSVSGEDVTEQVFDIEARLRNKRAEEAQYVDIMQRAKRIPDIISVSNELYRVREEIEKLQGRVKFLRSSADMSTISLTLTKPSDSNQPGITNSFKHAWKSLVRTSVGFMGMLIWLMVYSPYWLGLAAIIWLIRKKLASRRPKA